MLSVQRSVQCLAGTTCRNIRIKRTIYLDAYLPRRFRPQVGASRRGRASTLHALSNPATPNAPPPSYPDSSSSISPGPSFPLKPHSSSPSPPEPKANFERGLAPVPSDAQRRTIYALATPPGKGGVAVIRISGPDALAVYGRVVRPVVKAKAKGKSETSGLNTSSPDPEPRRMIRCTVVDSVSGEELDDGLAVFFKGPHSFTTEDVLELHLHSGRAIITAVLAALQRLSQPQPRSPDASSLNNSGTPPLQEQPPLLLRPAERGEFTRRAYLGGRVDLTQAEALRDLVDAQTEAQRKVALSGARGTARKKFESMREEIIRAMAMIEALIDFGEGEDLEEGVYDDARRVVTGLKETIDGYLSDGLRRRGEILRSGLRLAIFGPPNAGKSSLLNYLAGREAAIVTPLPGTTRDVLELTLDIGGLPVVVADTAGLRSTEDAVEQIGVERARERVAESDVSLCVLSITDLLASDADGDGHSSGLRLRTLAGNGNGNGVDTARRLSEVRLPETVRELMTPSTFVLLNKTDLVSGSATRIEELERAFVSDADSRGCCAAAGVWSVSLTSGEGLEWFLRGFGVCLSERYMPGGGREEVLVTNARQRADLERAREHLNAFLQTEDVVVAAEELRYAGNAVGKVTGRIDVEEVLDIVFREFCIGK